MVSFNIYDRFKFNITGERNKEIEDYLAGELGYFKSEVTSPDVEIELVDKFPEDEMSLPPSYGVIGNSFYLKDYYNNKVTISYRRTRTKLLAEKGIDASFLLGNIIEPLMFYCLLEKGFTFIHASAVSKGDNALTFAAWKQTGKTSAILSLLPHNYSYLSNDWSLISKEGLIYPYPTPIRVYGDNLESFPDLINIVSKNPIDKWKIQAQVFIYKVLRGLGLNWSRNLILRGLHLAISAISYRTLKIESGRFGSVGNVSSMEKLFFLVKNPQATEVKVEEIENDERLSMRLAVNLLLERESFTQHSLAYLFAFPESEDYVVSNSLKLQKKIIHSALEGVQCFRVMIPGKIPFREAFLACQKYF